MPNLILTTECANNCPYCFAGEQKGSKKQLHFRDLTGLLPLIRGFNHDTVNLLGGEPASNPDFLKILRLLLSEGYTVKIFTNGRLPGSVITELKELHQGEYSFCVNRSHPILPRETIPFYQKMGYKIQTGVTVFQTGQSFDHIRTEINQYHLHRFFRLGIALPTWPRPQNQFLHPRDYRTAAHNLFSFIQRALVDGIRPEFDCGFPYCFFDENQRRFLAENQIRFESNCGIIPDIGPDGSIKPCFPLASLAVNYKPESDWKDLQPKILSNLNKLNSGHLYPECAGCPTLIEKQCSGGCIALRSAQTPDLVDHPGDKPTAASG